MLTLVKFTLHLRKISFNSGIVTKMLRRREEEQVFIVMNSVFPVDGSKFISERFDLKGSTVGRYVCNLLVKFEYIMMVSYSLLNNYFHQLF